MHAAIEVVNLRRPSADEGEVDETQALVEEAKSREGWTYLRM